MHILGLNTVPDSEAHSQLGVCEKTAHSYRNDEHIQQLLLKAPLQDQK